MGTLEAKAFLTRLAAEESVATSTRSQALSALLLLYCEALRQDLGPEDVLRAKRTRWMSTVLTEDETLRLIGCPSGPARAVGTRTLRHSFATRFLEAHHDILTVQELLGHKDFKTTMTYTQALNRGGLPVRSPLH
jgi:site-specific recombinase XerC